MINKLKKFITDNKKDIIYIMILILLLLCISIPKLLMQYKVGIGNWDTFLYLENARNFAKMGWPDVQSIAPVLPAIISKMFLLAGHPYEEAIFNIDVVFYILGSVSLYLLFRLKFSKEISFLGSIIYSTFTLLFSWVAIGGNDIIGTTGTILTIYLIIVSHKYENRLYYLALPVAAYSFLSRYTAGIMLFAILLYWVLNRISLKEFKHILIGGILGIISISWFLYEFNKHLQTPFPFLGQFSGTVSNTVVLDSGFLPDSWYYINHIPNYLFSFIPNVHTFNAIVNPMGNNPRILAYAYIILMLIGLALIVIKTYRKVKSDNNGINVHYTILTLFLAVMFILSLVFEASYMITFIILFAIVCIIYFKISGEKIENLDYDLVMIYLFSTYLIFQSILFTKNDRYFITVLPFIAFFITNALNEIYLCLKSLKISKIRITSIITVVLVIFLLANSVSFAYNMPTYNKYNDIEESCMWIEDNHLIKNDTVTYSDNWPAVTWYLNIFCLRGVPDTTDLNYTVDFSSDVLYYGNGSYPAIFYIDTTSKEKLELAGFEKIKQIKTVQIYENKYVKEYGRDYIRTEDYNNNLRKEIDELNATLR